MSEYKSSWSVYARLLKYLKPVWFKWSLGILSSIFAGSLDGWLGHYVKTLVDQGVVLNGAVDLYWVPGYILVYFICRALLGFCSVYFLYQAGNAVVSRIRLEAFSKLMGSKYLDIKHLSTGGFLSLLNYNILQLEDLTTNSLRRFVLDASLIISAVVSLFSISFYLSCLILCLCPILYIVLRFFSYHTKIASENVQNQLGFVMRYAEQSIQAISTIRSMSAYRPVLEQFESLLHKNFMHQRKFTMHSSMTHVLLQFIISFPIAMVFALVLWGYLHLSPGDLSAFFYTVARIMPPVRALSLIVSSFQKGIAAAESVFAICDSVQENDRPGVGFVLDNIMVENLSLKINNSHVFRNVSSIFELGRIHVIVGPSGVGKSSFLNCLSYLINEYDGLIRIGEHDYHDFCLADFRKHVGYLDQSPFLWDDTALNNIIFPSSELNDVGFYNKIIDVVALDKWIESLPSCEYTYLGSDGLLPSGGQKQRLALARVLFQNNDILLLDEPTASLDEMTSRKILDYLHSIKHNKIIIIASHQYFFASGSDKVHFMSQDYFTSGSHSDLLKNPLYNMFWRVEK